jgi:hypothetical protein
VGGALLTALAVRVAEVRSAAGLRVSGQEPIERITTGSRGNRELPEGI